MGQRARMYLSFSTALIATVALPRRTKNWVRVHPSRPDWIDSHDHKRENCRAEREHLNWLAREGSLEGRCNVQAHPQEFRDDPEFGYRLVSRRLPPD